MVYQLYGIIILYKYIFYLMQVIPDKAEAYRLLGEVKFELKDYEGSSSSYRSALSVSKSVCASTFSALCCVATALLPVQQHFELFSD
jgi:hypothetical protein